MKSFLKGVHKVILFMQAFGRRPDLLIVLTTADVLLRIFGIPSRCRGDHRDVRGH